MRYQRIAAMLFAAAVGSTALGLAVPTGAWAVTCPTHSHGSLTNPAPQPGVDWRGCDLTYAILNFADLTDAHLEGANLTGAQLMDATLVGAHLAGARLDSADLSDADLSDADLADATLTNADLTDATALRIDLTRADLTRATMPYVDLTHGTMIDTTVAYANLTHAHLVDVDLTGAHLSHAVLAHANLHRANLATAELLGADLTHAELIDADLTSAMLTSVRADTANFNGANLAGAHLDLAELISAHLVGVHLQGAYLRAANLTSANMTGSDLTGAVLDTSQVSGAVLTDAYVSCSDTGELGEYIIALPFYPDPVLPAGWALTDGRLIVPVNPCNAALLAVVYADPIAAEHLVAGPADTSAPLEASALAIGCGLVQLDRLLGSGNRYALTADTCDDDTLILGKTAAGRTPVLKAADAGRSLRLMARWDNADSGAGLTRALPKLGSAPALGSLADETSPYGVALLRNLSVTDDGVIHATVEARPGDYFGDHLRLASTLIRFAPQTSATGQHKIGMTLNQ